MCAQARRERFTTLTASTIETLGPDPLPVAAGQDTLQDLEAMDWGEENKSVPVPSAATVEPVDVSDPAGIDMVPTSWIYLGDSYCARDGLDMAPVIFRHSVRQPDDFEL
jgi:hypothetical protein